ncbi:coenzyme F420-0:L-glutamate ligase/coenzyme F420-1:gamma-L-glutamate ligase [Motilibacter peucedani]|uniref:Coenzyme F420-0:L-glutamate ligase/coenzyme F420-1:gamma-L-glutamate ligase n=1 Tax=Motilibacter peucedani TaxID=598650 RepID=A0A420XLR3_9ACTN|nr:coenzyme F420-0:L-glutamate ligase [Motilibacter peucedani]RKS71432.1 coenzyme F420-0:L-glutamate ligase/coenzyme F420-1:gamma-L-glutamate ligase [Motilibacter peucedani]
MTPPPGPVTVLPVTGLPEVAAGDDLGALLDAALPQLAEGDVVVVSSKVVAKAEGRALRGVTRDEAVTAETVRVVARRGPTRIVETRHGLVLAAAGVDESNVEPGTVLLLPSDPDASARALRAALRASRGLDRLGVVVTDTAGRAWRQGQTDIAVGAAGVRALHDLRGSTDSSGRVLDVTLPALGDELAGAADLVKGKATGVPAAVVRGLGADALLDDDGPGAAALVRPADEDLFRWGTAEARAQGARAAVGARRTVRSFAPGAPDPEAVRRALAAAVTAPAPHHTVPWRFAVVETAAARTRLLDAMQAAWEADLRVDGFSGEQVARRVRRGAVLRGAPLLVVPCLVSDGAHDYPDARRSAAERSMFVLAAGAGIEALLVALAAEGLGSAWVSSALFCPDAARAALDLDASWEPMGTVAVGVPAAAPPARPERPLDELVVLR